MWTSFLLAELILVLREISLLFPSFPLFLLLTEELAEGEEEFRWPGVAVSGSVAGDEGRWMFLASQ